MNDPRLRKAILLAGQNRHDLAADELRAVLAAEPDHAFAHAWLGVQLAELGRRDEAVREVERAAGLAPDDAVVWWAQGLALAKLGRLPAALVAAQRAVRLDPFQEDHHGLAAAILLQQKRWQEALHAAEEALRLDPEHVQALNVRALALVKLGRGGEARSTMEAALRADPEDAQTHAAQGWTLLHHGDARGAIVHFQEALRRDADLEAARAGLVEALKARNRVYRAVLRAGLWMDRFTAGRQALILVGAFVAYRVALSASEGLPVVQNVTIALWLTLVVLSWGARPLFNFLLLAHPLGRRALRFEERWPAVWFGLTVGAALVGVGAWAGFGTPFGKLGALAFGLLALPVAIVAMMPGGWRRAAAAIVAAALLLGVLATFASWWIEIASWQTQVAQGLASADAKPAAVDAAAGRFFAVLQACGFSTWLGLVLAATARR
ncbi:MAG: tetratricopeptide repeat protein [Planctomycetes bacterium]|nr:tetratricopeptide repeat protein [Planctomycetota bacterium]